MKIVILGNMGYVGPGVVELLRTTYPTAILVGFDTGFFASCLTDVDYLPERKLDQQFFGDIRNFPDVILQNADAVINLAAISNDPMGSHFEKVTMDVNHVACIQIAKKAKSMGVKSFVFASSCSIYGESNGVVKTEDSNVNPLTAYARSKVYSERDLRPLADKNFAITCLRFGTACGMSPRLRLDLALNGFVADALSTKLITILSDGTQWRPLIDVKDMAAAMVWAVGRIASSGAFLAINTGSEMWNYQVKQLAEAVGEAIPDSKISVSKEPSADKRSFMVSFDLYKILAPNHQPKCSLSTTIKSLKDGLESMSFKDPQFRDSKMMRLKVLTSLQSSDRLTNDLRWNLDS
jgi:nucleoside-diphosphate-sugar epimerase